MIGTRKNNHTMTTASRSRLLLSFLILTQINAQSLPGCYPAWQSQSTYAASTIVSLSTLTNEILGTYVDYNYECISDPVELAQYCGQEGFQPGLNGDTGAWNVVWTQLSECSGTAVLSPPTPSPTLSLWDGTGCPPDYEINTAYDENDRVVGEDGNVYQCKPFPYSGSCGQSGFEPGQDGSSWKEVWTQLGSCQGTISPTTSPNYNLPVFGGCPEAFSSDSVYEEGDLVSFQNIVFKCLPFPYSAWCSHELYAPATTTQNWQNAWEMTGTCDGTMSPTASPAFDALVDVNGCPDEYVEGSVYEGGDRVTLVIEDGRGIVYKCADEWPDSGYCTLIQPGHDSGLGWTLQGGCEGTIAPSTSPIFVSLADTAGCPNEYASSASYESGDRVAVYVDADRAVVWECNEYPSGAYCNQFSPIDDTRDGWRMVGSCTGTIAPTTSPNFVGVAATNGCPEDYSSSTRYEVGDLVTVIASSNPLRQMVYECNSEYCNAGTSYAPGSENSSLGWQLKGYCDGTIAPTSSPAGYTGSCQYNDGTSVINIDAWSQSDLATYNAGTRVRKSNRVYQCKSYPYYLWCRMSMYEPEKGDYWNDAWMSFGTC